MRNRGRDTLPTPKPIHPAVESVSPPPVVAATRERLLETAGEIFAEKGFKGATIREIIDRAGVNIAAVNYYFRDKERLYIEAVKQVACAVPVEKLRWPAKTPPVVKLRDFIQQMAGHLLDPARPAWHARLLMREMARPTSACAELVRDYIAPRAAILAEIVREFLPPNTPRWQHLLTCFSIVGQILFYVAHKPVIELLTGPDDLKHFSAAAVSEHIAQFTLRALKAE